ncbi:Uncharacterised protein [Yersinia thracica]|uniref:Uncharacterized protein n=1 Tax=Yersinia thracica TaxID=2890319 RepID=A0A0T9NAY4_9GAMM|nr:Uncharacterised protein [Yersinia thracica]
MGRARKLEVLGIIMGYKKGRLNNKLLNIITLFIRQYYIRRIAMLTREMFLVSLVLSDRHSSSITGIVLR